MTLVASPRTRNLSLSSARAVPASTRAVAISSATLVSILGVMSETSFDVCDLDRGERVDDHRGAPLACERTGASNVLPNGRELLRLFDFVARRYRMRTAGEVVTPHHAPHPCWKIANYFLTNFLTSPRKSAPYTLPSASTVTPSAMLEPLGYGYGHASGMKDWTPLYGIPCATVARFPQTS